MKKEISVLFFLLSASFSLNLSFYDVYESSPQLAKQLYVDDDFAQKYFGLFSAFPEIADFDFPGIYDLRQDRSAFMISLELAKTRRPHGLEIAVDWIKSKLGVGYISTLNDLLEKQETLFYSSNVILSADFHKFFNERVAHNNLDYFQSRFETKGRNFFQLKNEKFTSYRFEFPTIFQEWGCLFENVVIPKELSPILTDCRPNLFLTNYEQALVLTGWSTVIDELNLRLSWLKDYYVFVDLAKQYTQERENRFADACNVLDADKDEDELLIAVLNDSLVRNALFTVSSSNELTSKRISFSESPLHFCYEPLPKPLGKRAEFLDKFLLDYDLFQSLKSQQLKGIEQKVAAMEALCVDYGGDCYFSDKDLSTRLLKTSRVFVSLRAQYLNKTSEAIQLSFQSLLSNAKELLNLVQPYLSDSTLAKYLAKLRDIEDLGPTEKNNENLNKFIEDLTYDFLSKHISEAKEIKAELLALAEDLKSKGETVAVRDLPLNYDSPISNFVYYLSNEDLIAELKEAYAGLLDAYGSNLPSYVNCTPTTPLSGSEFEVSCTIIVENHWGGVLKSGHAVVSLPYPPLSLSSKNFVGDVSNLESVSFFDDVRLNLKNVPDALFFKATYLSKLPATKFSCHFVESIYSCSFYPVCSYESVYVSLPHPFSGKKMNATADYYFDGEQIFVKIPCRDIVVNFTGPTYELISEEGTLKIINLINDSTWVHETLQVNNKPVEIGFELKPGEEKTLPIQTLVRPLENESIKMKLNESPSTPINLIGAYSDFLIYLNRSSTFGCIEGNIYAELHSKYGLPSLRCFDLHTDDAKRAYKSGDRETAFKIFLNTTKNPNYLAFKRVSDSYKKSARDLLALRKDGVLSRFSKPYWEKAEIAYANGDYIVSIYYSKYALKKSSIKLGVDFRMILALLFIGYGLYSVKKDKKDEELI